MLKKVGAIVLASIMLSSSLPAIAADINDRIVPDDVTVAGYPSDKGFDPETVMWTDNPIENVLAEQGIYSNAAEVNPNASNKETTTIQAPYGNSGKDFLTPWAYSEFIWTNSYPVGNGRMAGMVAGGIDKEVIQINEDTSWDGSPYGTLEDENGNRLTTLAQIHEANQIKTVDQTSGSIDGAWRYFRGANEDGTPAEIGAANVLVGDQVFRDTYPDFANKSIANQALNVNNAKELSAVQQRYSMERMVEKTILGSPKRQRAYKSFVEVYLDFGQQHSKAADYTKSLDMETGVVTIEYDYEGAHFKRETIASYPDQVIATHVESTKDLNFSAELHTYHEDSAGKYYKYEKVSDKEVKLTATISNGSKDNNEVGTVNAIKFEARLFLEGDGNFSVSEDNKSVIVSGGKSADIYVVGATNYVDYLNLDNTKPERDCEYYKANVLKRTYAQIKDRHIADFAPEFAKSSLTLQNDTKYANEFSNTPTEQRVRQDIKGKSGFLTGSGSNLSNANKAGVYSTYTKGDNQLATLEFNYGKYLILAGARDGRAAANADEIDIPQSQPLNLTGKWNAGLSASWNGKYTININTEMNYWAAQPLNIGESEKTLIDTFDELAQGGAITAANQYAVYNERGDDTYQPGDPWVMHHNFDLWRGTQPIDNATAGLWPTGGIWLLDHAWQYYQFKNDTDYLAEVYPYMVGAAKFFVETLVIDSKTGYLITAASCSPEHGGVQPGAAMDTQLIRNLYDMVQQASQILGKTTEDAALLAKIAEQMPATYLGDEKGKVAPNLIDKSGLIQEWARGNVTFDFSIVSSDGKYKVTNPFENNAEVQIKEHAAGNTAGHRHCSHLWELYPGTHLNPYSEDENEKKIFAAYQKATSARGPGSGQGWGLAWRISLNARSLDGETSSKMLEQLFTTRTSPNLFDQHPNFQIDGNYGATAGMIEMLVQSHADAIDLLPAIPEKWHTGEFKGFNTRKGAIVDLSWDGGIPREAKVHATKTGDVSIRTKYAAQAKVYDSSNNLVTSALNDENNKLTFAMVDGETYTITDFGTSALEGDIPYYASSASDFFASDGGDAPKFSNNGVNIGYLYRRNGVKVGYALSDVDFDNLKQLKLNMVKVRDTDTRVIVTLDSKDGTEIANQEISTGDNILELKNIDGVTGKHKLYFAFIQDPFNSASDDKYLGDAADLIGSYSSEVDPNDPTAPPRPTPTQQPILGDSTPSPKPTTAPNYTYSIKDANIESDGRLSATLEYIGETGGDSGKLMVGAYNTDGVLVDSNIYDVTGTTIENFDYVMPENAETVKLYIWDGIDTMVPLSAAKEAYQPLKPTATPGPTEPPIFATYADWNIGQISADGVDGEAEEVEYNGKTALNVIRRNVYKTLDSAISNGTAAFNTKVYIDPAVAKSFRIYLENDKAASYVDKTNNSIFAEVVNNTASAIDYGPALDTTTQLFSYADLTAGWYNFNILVDYLRANTDEFITLTVSDAEGNEKGSVNMGSLSGVDTALKQIRIVQTAVNAYVADMGIETGESPTIDPNLPTKPPATPAPSTDPEKTYTVDATQETNADNKVYNSVREAVLAVNANPPASEADRVYINVNPGVYRAQVDVKAPYVTLQKTPGTEGEAKLTWYYGTSQLYDSADSNGKYDPSAVDGSVGKAVYGWGGTLIVDKKANDFIARDLTLENSFNQYYTQEELDDILEVDTDPNNSFFKRVEWIKSQIASGVSDDTINNWLQSRTNIDYGGVESSPRERACALYASGDRSQFLNCRVISKQDTIGINTGRMFFKDCFLAGTVDYICGSADALFLDCELNFFSGPNMLGKSDDLDAGTVTAPSNPQGSKGYLFYNCHITGTQYTSPGTLGRAWSGVNASANYINTVIDKCTRSGHSGDSMVVGSGWGVMGGTQPKDARFHEYNSVDPNGKAVDLSSRPLETKLNEWSMLYYNPYVFTSGNDAWDPANFADKYEGVNSVINATTIDTSDASTNTVSLPSAPSGYEFSWESSSEYATVSSDKTKITVVRPANGEAPIQATVKLYVRESANKTIGGEKSIAFDIQPTMDIENVFAVNGTVNLSKASDADQAITIKFMNGEAVIKTTIVTVSAGSTSQTYSAANIPVGSYVAYPTTANTEYNVTPVSQEITGTKGQEINMDINARKMETIKVSSDDFSAAGYTPSITSATGFSAGAYTVIGDETANLGEAGNVVYKLTKDEGKTVAAKTGVSFDIKSMLPAGSSLANTKTIQFRYDFLMETIDFYPSEYSYFDLATSKTNAGKDAADQTRFARVGVHKSWGQLNFFDSLNARINGDNTQFDKNNVMANKWYQIVCDVDLENQTIYVTAYDKNWKDGDAGTHMLNKKPFTISAPDGDGINLNYPKSIDLSNLYFNIYMDKKADTSTKMEYYLDNIEVEYQDFE